MDYHFIERISKGRVSLGLIGYRLLFGKVIYWVSSEQPSKVCISINRRIKHEDILGVLSLKSLAFHLKHSSVKRVFVARQEVPKSLRTATFRMCWYDLKRAKKLTKQNPLTYSF